MEKNEQLIRFEEMEVNKSVFINMEDGSAVEIDNIKFRENIVSKVEFVKHKFDDGCSLFIHAYAGNLCLTTTIVKEDYIIEKSELAGCQDFYIRKTREYDYV